MSGSNIFAPTGSIFNAPNGFLDLNHSPGTVLLQSSTGPLYQSPYLWLSNADSSLYLGNDSQGYAFFHVTGGGLPARTGIYQDDPDAVLFIKKGSGAPAPTNTGGLYIANGNEKIYLHTNGVGSPVNIENFGLVTPLPIYPDDVSAGLGGLVTGDIFCSADGVMRIKQ